MALRPHYDLVTLMGHMGSSLDRLEVDQRGRTFPPRAPRRLGCGDAEPQRVVSSHLNSAFALCDRPLLKADPCKTMVRSLQFTHYSRIHQLSLEVFRGPHKTSKTSDAHAVGPGRPCRTRGPSTPARERKWCEKLMFQNLFHSLGVSLSGTC